MQKQHRVLLFTIIAAAVVAIVWMLPSRVHQTHTCTTSTDVQVHTSTQPVDQCGRSRMTDSKPSRPSIQPRYGARVVENIESEAVLCYLLDGKPVMLPVRRVNMPHPAKRLLGVGSVSTRTAPYRHTAKPLHYIIPASNPTLAAVLDVPLNRGPTPSV